MLYYVYAVFSARFASCHWSPVRPTPSIVRHTDKSENKGQSNLAKGDIACKLAQPHNDTRHAIAQSCLVDSISYIRQSPDAARVAKLGLWVYLRLPFWKGRLSKQAILASFIRQYRKRWMAGQCHCIFGGTQFDNLELL